MVVTESELDALRDWSTMDIQDGTQLKWCTQPTKNRPKERFFVPWFYIFPQKSSLSSPSISYNIHLLLMIIPKQVQNTVQEQRLRALR